MGKQSADSPTTGHSIHLPNYLLIPSVAGGGLPLCSAWDHGVPLSLADIAQSRACREARD